MGSISAITHGLFLPPEGQIKTQGKSRSGLRSQCKTPSSRVTSHIAGGQERQLRVAGMGGGDNQAKQPGSQGNPTPLHKETHRTLPYLANL